MTPATDAASLFAQYSDRLVRYLSGVAGEREAARDLTQEVFLRVSRTAIPVAPQDQLAGWLFRIARNVAVDHHRQRRRRPETDIDSVPEATGDAQQEMALALKQALATLPDLDRDVFLLREVSGLSRKEIATACDLTVDAVRSRIFRIQWTRSRDNGKPSSVGNDTELTLRPGQALTLDLMPQSDQASGAWVSLSLGVGVVYWPEPDKDRRLLSADLWLVERLPDGKERSQPLSLRGLYNQAIPFHFETLSAGTKTLDVFGDLQISPGAEMGIRITTRSRVIDSTPYPRPRSPGYPAEEPWPPLYVGSTSATLKIRTGEVVSVPLAPVGRGGADAEAFAAQALSFRIRVRQVR